MTFDLITDSPRRLHAARKGQSQETDPKPCRVLPKIAMQNIDNNTHINNNNCLCTIDFMSEKHKMDCSIIILSHHFSVCIFYFAEYNYVKMVKSVHVAVQVSFHTMMYKVQQCMCQSTKLLCMMYINFQ